MAELTVSIVIPTYRDVGALTTLLPELATHNSEIIVVSGEPNSETASLCDRHKVQYIDAQPCRGAQLDTGARQSRGEVIWFLHADAAPPADAIIQIRTAIAKGATAGFFPFKFSGASTVGRRLLAAAINLRVSLGGIPYGDQGLFATRQAYDSAGGFPHLPLFEEVQLVKNLRRQGNMVRVETPTQISPRRWERDGWWRRSLHNRWLALRFLCGTAPQDLAQSYVGTEDAGGETGISR